MTKMALKKLPKKKTSSSSTTPNLEKGTVSKKSAPIADMIVSVAELPEFINLEIWGRSGSGKTTIAASAPTPILFIDCQEKGTRSVRKHKDVYVLRITTGTELEEIYWALKNGTAGRKYKTVVLDTVTQLQDIAIAHVRGGRSGTVSQRTWGDAASLMKKWIIDFRDLEMHTIFLAQDRIDRENEDDVEGDDEDNGMLLPEMGPSVMPSVGKTLNAAIDIAGQAFIRDKIITTLVGKTKKEKKTRQAEFCLRVGPHPIFYTKFREDMIDVDRTTLPDVLINPTFDDIVNLAG